MLRIYMIKFLLGGQLKPILRKIGPLQVVSADGANICTRALSLMVVFLLAMLYTTATGLERL